MDNAKRTIIKLQEIKNLLPHRWLFLLVTSDVVLEENKATTRKYFGFCWWLLCKLGHFPQKPIVPGVVFIELCAQLAALIIAKNNLAPQGIPTFRSTKATFSKPLYPLNIAYAEVIFKNEKMGLFFFSCKICNYAGEILSTIEITGTSVPIAIFNEETAINTHNVSSAA